MFVLKNIKYTIICLAVLLTTSLLASYAQEAPLEQAINDTASNNSSNTYDANSYDEEGYSEDYEDEYYESGPFKSGFTFKDSIDKSGYNQRSIKNEDWKSLSNKPEYVYLKTQPKTQKIEPVKDYQPNWFDRFIESFFEFLFSGAGKVLLWIIFACVVLLIVYNIFKNRGIYLFARGKGQINSSSNDEFSDDFVPKSWEEVIAQAEKSNNYRLALRHSYRHILHLMQNKNLITSKSSDSNYKYLIALKQTPYHDNFKSLLRHYEYTWYGKFEINESDYQNIKPIYINLKANL